MTEFDYDGRMTIGNLHDARHADTCPQAHYIDAGTTRQVYLIDGVIYKVESVMFSDDQGANQREFDRYLTLRDMLPEGFRIPEMTLYSNGVLACEFIEGAPTGECFDEWAGMPCECNGLCISIDTLKPIRDLGMHDLGYGNVIANDIAYWLIDLGE